MTESTIESLIKKYEEYTALLERIYLNEIGNRPEYAKLIADFRKEITTLTKEYRERRTELEGMMKRKCQQLIKAINCLRLEIDQSIVNSVEQKTWDLIDAIDEDKKGTAIRFSEYMCENFVKLHGTWCKCFTNSTDPKNWKSGEDIYDEWIKEIKNK